MDKKELDKILSDHKTWLASGGDEGERADLSYADLSYADLSNANLSNVDLSNADLSYADLSNANLSNVDLSCADLRHTIGNMDQIKSGQIDAWPFAYTHDRLQVGCQNHEIADWWRFGDAEISKMDFNAVEWWSKWRNVLKHIIKLSPAGK